MAYIPNLTSAAFQFSVEKLASENPKIYFWTFTFKHVPYNDAYAMEDWDFLHRRLVTLSKGIKGLRVAELHRSRGIHFHMIVNRRIPIDRIKKLFRGTGHLIGNNRYLDFGRLSVSKCDAGVASYLAKYLTKSYKTKTHCNFRRWGFVGGFKGYRIKDLEYIDDSSRNRKKLYGKRQVSFATMMMIKHYSSLWGKVKNWPAEHLALVMMQRNPRDTETVKQMEKKANETICARLKQTMERFPKKTTFNPAAAISARKKLAGIADALCRANGELGGENWDGETGYEIQNSDSMGGQPF